MCFCCFVYACLDAFWGVCCRCLFSYGVGLVVFVVLDSVVCLCGFCYVIVLFLCVLGVVVVFP